VAATDRGTNVDEYVEYVRERQAAYPIEATFFNMIHEGVYFRQTEHAASSPKAAPLSAEQIADSLVYEHVRDNGNVPDGYHEHIAFNGMLPLVRDVIARTADPATGLVHEPS